MASFEEFKTFIKDKPFLKEKFIVKAASWYETVGFMQLIKLNFEHDNYIITKNKSQQYKKRMRKMKKSHPLSLLFNCKRKLITIACCGNYTVFLYFAC